MGGVHLLLIGTFNGLRLWGVVQVIVVDKRIMQFRLKHTLNFMSLVALYPPTVICEANEKKMSYAKLELTLDTSPRRSTRCFSRIQCRHRY